MLLSGKKILIGITGGIAAYKVCDLIRLFIKAGADVQTVLTPNALNFVTETTLKTLTKNPVYIEQFSEFDWKPGHISLADKADLFIIAPASANTIGKIANGICDNLLTSIVMAFNKPVLLAPAMNSKMWDNGFVQENLKKLVTAGFYIINPAEGELACGYEGKGRLADIHRIFEKSCELLQKENFLNGKKIIITAGGTKEPIDPVRHIGNNSSGKMGIALADAAYKFGADVCLISTLMVEKPYEVCHTPTALEMLDVLKQKFPSAYALIMAAAVSDYRAENVSENKIKKSSHEQLSINLIKNPDILQEISRTKTSSQVLIGFCAETENLRENAIKKLVGKNLDYIVANDVSQKETGFDSDYNAIILFDKEQNECLATPGMPKTELARLILKKVFNNSIHVCP